VSGKVKERPRHRAHLTYIDRGPALSYTGDP
jgi:hypothetical protein